MLSKSNVDTYTLEKHNITYDKSLFCIHIFIILYHSQTASLSDLKQTRPGKVRKNAYLKPSYKMMNGQPRLQS